MADRIAGALTDLAYQKSENPKIASEVLIGHGIATVLIETSETITKDEVCAIVQRILPDIKTKNITVKVVKQDEHLAENQKDELRCGDNGIFKGCPVTEEQYKLALIARRLQFKYPSDGKYLINDKDVTICQSQLKEENYEYVEKYLREVGMENIVINPLGEWDGGTDVDCGATNRKLGSDMGDAVTGSGLHGKDLSKADVSVNIYLHLKAQEERKVCEAICNIGDTEVDGKPFSEIVEIAKKYVESIGGFEKLAEWGLIRFQGKE